MRWLVAAALALLCTLGFAAPDSQDKAGSSDPPPFTRMKGFHIYNFDDKPFDRFEFPVAPDKVQVVEGRRLYVDYYANEGVKHPSALQIVRNYSNAAKAIGKLIMTDQTHQIPSQLQMGKDLGMQLMDQALVFTSTISSGASVWPMRANSCSTSAAVATYPSGKWRKSSLTAGCRHHSSGTSSMVIARLPSSIVDA